MIKKIIDWSNLFSLALICLVFGLDIFIKKVVLEHAQILPLFVASFFGKVDLWIDLVYNQGAAWGSFANYATPLLIVRFIILFVVLVLFFRSKDLTKKIAYSLVIAGAFGNLYDTFSYGRVIDMVHFIFFGKSFGIFNLADTSIFIGLITLLLAKKRVEI
ncbi:MAG: signal peptidase II [Chlamydiia bacterium]|jgi:signal peptidase II